MNLGLQNFKNERLCQSQAQGETGYNLLLARQHRIERGKTTHVLYS